MKSMLPFSHKHLVNAYHQYAHQTWRKSYPWVILMLIATYVISIVRISSSQDKYMTSWAFHLLLITSILNTLCKWYLMNAKDKSYHIQVLLSDLAVFACFLTAIIADNVHFVKEDVSVKHFTQLIIQYLVYFIVVSMAATKWWASCAMLMTLFITISISAIVLDEEGIGFGYAISEIIVISFSVIVKGYFYEHKVRYCFENKYESVQTWNDIFYVLPEGVVLLNKQKTLNFINPALLSILAIEDTSEITFNKIFKDLDITILRSVQENNASSMFSTRPFSVSDNLLSRLSKPKNLNDLHHLIWKNWDEIKAYFDRANGFNIASFNNYLTFHAELTLPNKDKKLLEIKFAMKAFAGKTNCIFLMNDMTNQVTLESTKQAEDSRYSFLGSISHELKTPVNRTINYLQAALDDKATPKSISNLHLAPALNCAKFLMIIINDVLDLSQILRNNFRLVLVSKSLINTINEAIKTCEIQAKIKNLKLELKLPNPAWDSYIKTDHNRLLQVISNILSRAIKHTFAGRVVVIVNREKHNYVISVQDSSIGLGEQEKAEVLKNLNQKNFFENLFSSDEAGLGITISNLLARTLGPQSDPSQCGLQIESAKGKGTTIFFKVEDRTTGKSTPEDMTGLLAIDEKAEYNIMDIEPQQIRNRTSFDPNSPETHHFKIVSGDINLEICSCTQVLVISDDSANIALLENILHDVRIITEPVFSVSLGLNSVSNRLKYPCSETCQFYKAIFIDCDMLDSLEQAQLLKDQLKKFMIKCPIIGLKSNFASVLESKSTAVDSFITKPFNQDLIVNTMKNLGVY